MASNNGSTLAQEAAEAESVMEGGLKVTQGANASGSRPQNRNQGCANGTAVIEVLGERGNSLDQSGSRTNGPHAHAREAT